MEISERMTGAELATMRQACGLSRDDLARMACVQTRTIKHWESGHAGVPADVANTVYRISMMVQDAVLTSCRDLVTARTENVVLVRYRTDADLHRCVPDSFGMPVGAHGAMVARMIGAMQLWPGLQDIRPRVVWFDRSAFDAWLEDEGLPDGEPALQAWAASQVAVQAMPHRGDQPVGIM